MIAKDTRQLPLPLFAQAALETPPALAAPGPSTPTVEDDKLRLCIENAGKDPATSLADAARWVAEAKGPGKSKALECLGQVYAVLGKWDAAEGAFSEGANLVAASDPTRRSALLAQAGNAALAANKAAVALDRLDKAVAVAGIAPLARGQAEIDRGRALATLGRPEDAVEAFANAQRDAPDDGDAWLLGATIARRRGDLAAAQRQIEVAGRLAPTDPEVGLEAGVIAMLAGNEPAARKAWESTIAVASGSKAAETAKAYLAQIAQPAPESHRP